MTIPRDIVIVGQSDEQTGMPPTGEATAARRLPRPAPVGFRRCSLEHAKHVEEAKRYQRQSSARRPAPRRSSLKTSSAYTSSSSSSSYGNNVSGSDKRVAFDGSVRMKVIEYRDQAYLEAAWLSQQERVEIQNEARSDVRTIKHLTKHPHLVEDSPELRQLRSSMSLRGLEQFYSKRIHRGLVEEQANVIYDVLELQDELNESSRSFGTQHDRAARIARVSCDGSLPARERAVVQGREDEAAVRKYLARERSASLSVASTSSASATQAQTQDAKRPAAAPPAAQISSRSLEDGRPPRSSTTAAHQKAQRRASMPTVRSSDAFSTDRNGMVGPY